MVLDGGWCESKLGFGDVIRVNRLSSIFSEIVSEDFYCYFGRYFRHRRLVF